MSETTPLESRYRQALRAYPAQWRAKHGEELLGVMLDVAADEGRLRPTASELLHLTWHGTYARVNRLLSILPRRRRDRLAAVGSVAGTALALAMMVLGELGRWFRWNSYTLADAPFGRLTTPASVVFLLVIAAFAATALGLRAAGKALYAAAAATSTALAIALVATDPTIPVHPVVFVFFTAASLLALLGNPTRTAALRALVLYASPALGVFLTLISYLQGGGSQRTFWGGPYTINDFTLAMYSLALLTLAALLAAAGRKSRPWACLILIPLASLPVAAMLQGMGGSTFIGLISMRPDVFYICCALGIISAGIAGKRVLSTLNTTASPGPPPPTP